MAFWSKVPSRVLIYKSLASYIFFTIPLSLAMYVAECIFGQKKRNVVLFVLPYAEYCENTRDLFNFWRLNQPGGTPIIFVYNKNLFEKLRPLYPENVVFAKSGAGFKAFMSSSLCFTSRGSINKVYRPYVYLPRFKYLVNLWHGIPLKRLGKQTKNTWEQYIKWDLQKFGSMLACSKAEQLALAACYPLSIDDIWITDTPRNDALFKAKARGGSRKKIILYAPTWRDGLGNAVFFPFEDFDIDRLEKFLAENEMQLILRPHLVERSALVPKFGGSAYISIDAGDPMQNVSQLLLETEILITDYSSIYLDYIALDRPIIFLPYDQSNYERLRGFMFDYDEITPGAKVYTFDHFLSELECAISFGARDSGCRRAVCNTFHAYLDGNACHRVAVKAIETVKERYQFFEPSKISTPNAVPRTF